jgi:hypothetical protein
LAYFIQNYWQYSILFKNFGLAKNQLKEENDLKGRVEKEFYQYPSFGKQKATTALISGRVDRTNQYSPGSQRSEHENRIYNLQLSSLHGLLTQQDPGHDLFQGHRKLTQD